jgi:ABC-2 type transport system ATP-binding protein
VFVSSHQLGEIQQICDRLAILRGGRCIAAGPVRDLLTIGRTAGLLVRVGNGDTANGDTANALAALRTAGMRVEPADDGLLLVDQPHVAAHVTETLARDRLWVTEMRPQELSLEDVFLELTESAP